MNQTLTKTRFAPSPTGLVHLGNIRTALFNALYAKKQQGTFLLRIEDTDAERSKNEFTQQLMADMRWLGLDWQEGAEINGSNAPYFQSQRADIYAHYYNQLEQQNAAYPCFCSPQELSISRKLQLSSGRAPRYAGTCAHLTPEEIQRKLDAGLQPTLRFRVPKNTLISFEDVVRGSQRFQGDDIGDFIIRRADGSPAFFFCNAVDDSLMGVSLVLRGEDHLTNTPRQLLILKALNLQTPDYGHISLIVGDDGSPLSKRHGSQSLKDLHAQGWLPQAIVNYLARLGHTYTQDHFMSIEELAQYFELSRLGKAPARFDAQQMHHWQQIAVSHLESDALWNWLEENTRSQIPVAQKEAFISAVRPNLVFPKDAEQWVTVLFSDLICFESEATKEIETAGKAFFEQALQAIETSGTNWSDLTNLLKTSSGKKGKSLFMPLRSALTGKTHGPEMGKLLPLLGKDRAVQRLKNAYSLAE
jgi:nondiscriminating glutamyl-tRNA synthetase